MTKTSSPRLVSRAHFQKELDSIADWYSYSGRLPAKLLEQHFHTYLELTFQPDRYEIITGGTGRHCCESFVKIAKLYGGIGEETIEWFISAYQAFPDSILGIKLPVDRIDHAASPTLYVRSKCSRDTVFTWLLDCGMSAGVLNALAESMKDNNCFYGLGFTESEGRTLVKTYTIDQVDAATTGFVSYRIHDNKILPVRKEYLPEVPIDEFQPPTSRWAELVDFLESIMNYRTAGHLGYEVDRHGISHLKIYVERIGAIPTDFEAK